MEMSGKLQAYPLVVAVSGGVDSMVLLHMLAHDELLKNEHNGLVVAHFNHGIRPDASEDEALVKAIADKYGLLLEVGYGRLGAKASEDTARRARYAFLEDVRGRHGAQAIATAHHQDDVVETAIINILRGTGRRGLSSLKSNPQLQRPLLGFTKQQIRDYALKHGLKWREDSSNLDETYLRNRVRHQTVPHLQEDGSHEKLLKLIANANKANSEISKLLDVLIEQMAHGQSLKRHEFVMLPHIVAKEVLMHWLRQQGVRQFDRRQIERLTTTVKTARPGTQYPVSKRAVIVISKYHIELAQ